MGEWGNEYSPANEKEPERKDGLTKEEGKAMDLLVEAWNGFIDLERTHVDEINYFADGVHMCQQMLMNRVLRRDYPEGYPIKLK